MADWVGIKYALNSSLGTEYFRPLDQMISATMVLEGASGTKFDITNTTTGETFSVNLASGESKVIVPVPLGNYTIEVTYAGKTTTVNNFVVGELGKPYKVFYVIELARFTTNGTFIVPSGLTSIYIDAAGGGGGGGGRSSTSGSYGQPGGGGGGGASAVMKYEMSVFEGENIPITIGVGGNGASNDINGYNGTATIIGSKLTLAGGYGGGKGDYTVGYGQFGERGGDGGGNGGIGNGKSNGSSGSKGILGKGGMGGSGYMNSGGGGGGGGSYGKGGDGGGLTSNTGIPAEEGEFGGGGGGGGGQNKGAKGGNGIVIFYIEVTE